MRIDSVISVLLLSGLVTSCQNSANEARDISGNSDVSVNYGDGQGNLNDVPSISANELEAIVKKGSSGDVESIRRLYMHYITSNNVEAAGKWAEIGARYGDCASVFNLTISHFEDRYSVNNDTLRGYILKYNCQKALKLYESYVRN